MISVAPQPDRLAWWRAPALGLPAWSTLLRLTRHSTLSQIQIMQQQLAKNAFMCSAKGLFACCVKEGGGDASSGLLLHVAQACMQGAGGWVPAWRAAWPHSLKGGRSGMEKQLCCSRILHHMHPPQTQKLTWLLPRAAHLHDTHRVRKLKVRKNVDHVSQQLDLHWNTRQAL